MSQFFYETFDRFHNSELQEATNFLQNFQSVANTIILFQVWLYMHARIVHTADALYRVKSLFSIIQLAYSCCDW